MNHKKPKTYLNPAYTRLCKYLDLAHVVINKCMDSVWVRFTLYISFAILGIVLLEKTIYYGWFEASQNRLAPLTATNLANNEIFQSALAVFILTFLIITYNWFLKNKDTTQQLKNDSEQQAEIMFSNALTLLFREGNNADSILAKSIGLKELLRLKHNNVIDAERIDIITSSELNLTDTKLQFADLIGANLQYANLQSANLMVVNLQKAKLQFANLQSANLQGAHLQDISLQHANLQNVNLLNANMQHANLINAKLQKARLERAQLQKASLLFANFKGANLQNAKLQEASLAYARLQGADMQGANMQNADLHNAQLAGANMKHANLQGADFQAISLFLTNLKESIIDFKEFIIDLEGSMIDFTESIADLKKRREVQMVIDLTDDKNLMMLVMPDPDLKGAIYDDDTKFPDKFSPDKAGMRHINYLTKKESK